jgi:hypothetical protein
MESNQAERKCPKCGGEMEVGFLRDRSRGNLSQPAEWMEGVPESTWFGSLKLGPLGMQSKHSAVKSAASLSNMLWDRRKQEFVIVILQV